MKKKKSKSDKKIQKLFKDLKIEEYKKTTGNLNKINKLPNLNLSQSKITFIIAPNSIYKPIS